jgi:hypothetical protein
MVVLRHTVTLYFIFSGVLFVCNVILALCYTSSNQNRTRPRAFIEIRTFVLEIERTGERKRFSLRITLMLGFLKSARVW